MVLKGLLFSAFILVLTMVISLLVVGVIAVIYRAIQMGKHDKTAAK